MKKTKRKGTRAASPRQAGPGGQRMGAGENRMQAAPLARERRGEQPSQKRGESEGQSAATGAYRA